MTNPKANKRFPLTLESVTGEAGRDRAKAAPRINSPQTAMKNAARQVPAASSSAQSTVAPAASHALPSPGTRHLFAGLSGKPRSSAPERGTLSPSLASPAVRKAMVDRIARQGVQDPVVLAAMENVPRHFFLEPGLASQAYIDAALPIGYQQTISQPYIVARMIEVLRAYTPGGLNLVLEIGTGCGYQAAVLAQVAKEVYSIERIKALHELARTNLRPLRIPNLRLHFGDGMLGLPDIAPFDGIILAAAGMDVPPALLAQMAVGGSLVAPVGADNQVLQLSRRTSLTAWVTETLEHCHFVPLKAGTLD